MQIVPIYPPLNSSPALPEVKDAPQTISSTPTSITLEFFLSVPVAEEYRLEYTQYGNFYFEEGKRMEENNQTSIVFTQDGLQPSTRYRFRIVPYTHGIRGRASPDLITSTRKALSYKVRPFKGRVVMQ